MILTEMDNDCVGCPQGCVHCGRGDFLALTDLICDFCGSSEDELYEYDGEQICISCLKGEYKVINDETFLDFI